MPRAAPAAPWALAALALASGCASGPSDPVRALIEELAEAGEDRDADRVLARLSETFRGQEALAKADVAGSLRRYFAAYESIELELFDVEVQRAEAAAQVTARVGFTGQASRAFGLGALLPPSAVYRFDLEAREEGGTWRVTGARWQPLETPAVSEAR
jgi:hypothetical protein